MRRLRAAAAHLARHGAAGELLLLRERDPPLLSPSEPHPVHAMELFDRAQFGAGITPAQKAQMDHDGHLLLPGLMTPAATARLIEAIRRVGEFGGRWKAGNRPKAILARLREMAEALDPASASYAADVAALQREKAEMYAQYPHAGDHSPGACPYEWDEFMEGIIGHPQMLALARGILGDDIRFDHQVLLNKSPGTAEQDYHTHEYADGRVKFGNIGPVPAPVDAEIGGQRAGLMSTQGLLGHHYERSGQLASSPFSVDDPTLGYIRIFFYASGFELGDGNL